MRRRTALTALILVTAALAGCIGGDDAPDPQSTQQDPTDPTADYDLPGQITGLEAKAAIDHGGAGGLVIQDDLAYVSGLDTGFYIADVTDPQDPEKLSELDGFSARDVSLFTVEGDLFAALGADGDGIHVVNVTDPQDPELIVESFTFGGPAHNIVMVPGTTLLYNSRSLGDALEPGIDILNLSDPHDPQLETVYTFPPTGGTSPVATAGCHDIEIAPEIDRAYCAAVTQTYILDISDPTSPEIVSTITNPGVNIHHWAIPSHDRDVLIIGDEFGGAMAPTTCLAHAPTPLGDVSQPYGALWFYDISDEETPTPQGWISAPAHATEQVCTSHFGQLLPDRDQVAVGWYTAGVLLVDFEDPMQPTLVDQWGDGETNVWDVQYTNGHLVTGDIGHGSDVIQLIGE